MKTLLIDTNIILDIALKRAPHFEHSSQIFELLDKKQLGGYITATTVTDIYYISRKEKGRTIAIEFISNLIEVVEVLGVDKNIIIEALKSNLPDFEDAVQISAAKFNKIGIIITRNKSDFLNTNLEILSAKEFIENQK